MPALLKDRERLKSLMALILPRPLNGQTDLSEGFRLRCYDELRRIAHGD